MGDKNKDDNHAELHRLLKAKYDEGPPPSFEDFIGALDRMRMQGEATAWAVTVARLERRETKTTDPTELALLRALIAEAQTEEQIHDAALTAAYTTVPAAPNTYS